MLQIRDSVAGQKSVHLMQQLQVARKGENGLREKMKREISLQFIQLMTSPLSCREVTIIDTVNNWHTKEKERQNVTVKKSLKLQLVMRVQSTCEQIILKVWGDMRVLPMWYQTEVTTKHILVTRTGTLTRTVENVSKTVFLMAVYGQGWQKKQQGGRIIESKVGMKILLQNCTKQN